MVVDEMFQEVLQGNLRLAQDLYKNLASRNKNVIFSPLEIHALFMLLSQDPGFQSNHAMDRILQIYEDKNHKIKYYKDILNHINTIKDVTLLTTKNIFFKEKQKLQESYNSFIKTIFFYEQTPLDFSKAEASSLSINRHVEDKTNKAIGSLTNSNDFDDKTRVAFLETLYFDGKWAQQFDAQNTVSETFYVSENNTVQIPMMKKKSSFKYKKDEYIGVKFLELPYLNNNVSLVIILPDGTIAEFEEKYYDLMHEIDHNLSEQEVNVSIPKFRCEEAFGLEHYLSEIGRKEQVIDDGCLFGMLDNDEFLKLSNIRHKALIKVDEKKTDACAGTMATSVLNNVDEPEKVPKEEVVIFEINVKTDISNRFAKTLVTCKVKNTEKSAKEANFNVVLPDSAFITEFVMEIGGKSYKSYIKGKEEAKNIYKDAVSKGQSAGLVEASTRDSNEFTVSVNLEPNSVGVFLLTYEEMLQRVHDQYEFVLNIYPRQFVESLNVEVNINESRPIKFVKTPPIRSGKEMSKNEKYLDPHSNINILTEKSAVVKFNPDLKRQKRYTLYLGSSLSEGFSGQFVVQYEVERDPQDGEILLQDGYFVHFFAPNDLDPLPKHVVFVLDTSSSMCDRKITQLKDAMMSILGEVRKNDIINIIEFNSDLIVWDINKATSITLECEENSDFENPFPKFSDIVLPSPAFVSDATIKSAKNVVSKIQSTGATYMIGGLVMALYLVKVAQEKMAQKSEKYQPIIVFLTDGQPNVGMGSTEEIVRIVTKLNTKTNKVPIFSLSFGTGADRSFLRKLSLKNMGFSRHIYEAADASLQLQEFYKQISSPLLSNITFKYDSEVEEVTRTHFPIYFGGSELVVTGRYKGPSLVSGIDCCGRRGPIIIKSLIERPVTSLERLWAYLTVKQLLEERNSVENKEELTKKAVELALRYSFVTDVTSLVVVKPEDTQPTNMDIVQDEEEGSFQSLQMDHANYALCSATPAAKFLPKSAITGLKKCKRVVQRCAMKLMSGGTDLCESEIELFEETSEESLKEKKKAPEVENFIANRPFLFILRLKVDTESIILFKGKMEKPTY